MRLALALAFLLLAGCASAPTTVKQAAVTPTANETSDAMPGMNMSGPAAVANESAPMAGMYAIQYDGVSPQGACTTTGTGADECQLVSSGKESFHLVEYQGKPKHVQVTITYGALNPGFQMYGAVCVGKAGAKVTVNDCKDYQTMPSPFKLDVDLSAAPAGSSIGLSVGSVAGGPGAIVFGGDAFKVAGHLMASG
jgi:hypothetical protein